MNVYERVTRKTQTCWAEEGVSSGVYSIMSHSTGVVYVLHDFIDPAVCASFQRGLESCGIAMDGWPLMGFLFWNDDGTKWDLIVIVVIWRTNCRICPSRNHVIDVSLMPVVVSERHRRTLADHWGTLSDHWRGGSSVWGVAQTFKFSQRNHWTEPLHLYATQCVLFYQYHILYHICIIVYHSLYTIHIQLF